MTRRRTTLRRAAAPAGDRASAVRLVVEAAHRARVHRAAVRAIVDDIGNLGRLVGAWAAGEYTRIPWRTIAAATAALAYFVDPLDLIPDAVPLAGFLDDAAVISMVVASIRRDIERFQRWEASGGESAPQAESA
jgi:uncharacterized membrane protein YkvA (DUF1232 family)